MWKLAPAIGLVPAACATGTAVRGEREGAARFDLAANAGTARGFPRAQVPQLPSADDMSRRIREEVGDAASAEVRLCAGIRRPRRARPGAARIAVAGVHRGARARPLRLAIFGKPALQRQSCGITNVSYRVN